MAVDLTLNAKNGLKKSVSISSGSLAPADEGTLASGEVVTLFNLPADSVVTNGFIVVKNAPTGGTQTLGIKVGGVAVIAGVALGTVDNAIKGGAVTKIATGTGAAVTTTVGVADLVDGEIEVVVEYIEYTKTNGELTN